MTLSMYQACVPTMIKQLQAMAGYIAKGEAHARETGSDMQALLDTRLAPDMLPLTRQIQLASDAAKSGVARLAGQQPPSMPDTETSFDELQARIAKTIAYVQSIAPADIDGSETREINLKAGEHVLTFTGQDYLLHFVLPNLFFHATTTYAILRSKGAPIGKIDFLGGMPK